MKNFTKIILVLLFLLILASLWVGYQLFAIDTSISFVSPFYIEIPAGASTQQIKSILIDAGLLRNPGLFTYTARITGLHKEIRAGRFRFDKPVSTWQLLQILTSGGSFDIQITIPEGFTIYEIAGTMQNNLGIDSLAFLVACSNSDLLKKIGIPGPTTEGFLFPETYNIPRGIRPDSIISMMYGEFNRRWKPEFNRQAISMGMSCFEVVVLASIIEEEAHEKSEQPIISSVYHNRLRIGMMLQADPTTIYGIKKFDKPLLLIDLDSDSPYNTYRHFGLPPGPICNPGLGAIRAAMNPDSTDYFYFVSRRDGTHIFSKTIQEHHRAIQRIKKLIKSKS